MINYTPMIQQYLSVKAEYQDAFLFFRLGDFYEMFFEDAELASKTLEITLTSRDGGNNRKIPMCGVPYHSAEAYITKLIEKGYKVAICEQVEDPKTAKGVVKREVVRVITPGTVMDGKLLEEKGNNYIASISFGNESFTISISDISTGEFYATEINGRIENLITELNQYRPSELLVEKVFYDEFHPYLQQLTSTFTYYDQSKTVDEIEDMLMYQFKNYDPNRLSKQMKISAGYLLLYLQKTQQQKLNHFNELTLYDTKQYMILDQFSKRNLELIRTSREQTKKGSLLWLLDKTETAMGSRLLRRWIEKPLLSIQEIENRLDIVEELMSDPILLEELKNLLKNIYDIERLISKVSYGNATPKDVSNLKNSIEKVPMIYDLLSSSQLKVATYLFSGIDLCEDIAQQIEQSIMEDPPLSPKVGGIIKRGYNHQLDNYYAASSEGKEWLYDLEQREKTLTGIRSLKVGFNKVFGYFIEVTKANLDQVPDRYIRKQTLANAERYITEELKDKETIILEAEEKMLDLEYELFSMVRDEIAEGNYRMQRLAQTIAKLDVLLAFAKIGVSNNYTRPMFNNEGKLEVKEGRHPVIEAVHKDSPFIPNDIYIDKEDYLILLITGPNMAGKSTYMRQIALISIMSQIGCFVPATNANLSIIDRIFTRIGAGDDLTSGQSTFMVEMIETKYAITQATENSLILLDEIGRGTSTYDGMALAQAIIQYIHDHVKAKTLFSTHYHELTGLADNFPHIQNIHVNVIEKDGRVIFLHKIEKGKADKSYGIHVAELAGMPEEVLENAKLILRELETKASTEGKNNQLELFHMEEEVDNHKDHKQDKLYRQIVKQIEEIDLLNMTPMDGFKVLYDIQKKIRK